MFPQGLDSRADLRDEAKISLLVTTYAETVNDVRYVNTRNNTVST